MKNIILLLIIFTFCLTSHSCKKDKNLNWFFITDKTSDRDSVRNIGSEGEKIRYISTKKNWYTPFVILLDSTDKVYIYQTELINKNPIIKHSFYEDEKCSDFTEFSNYIGLIPEQLLEFESNHFIEFIKNNQDVFEFDTINHGNTSFFTIASNKDTIQNAAFYDLKNLITIKKRYKRSHVCGLVRKTTEEENVVMYYKRRNIEYHPEKIKWSTNFIEGKYKPFTNEYQSVESTMKHKDKAINSINKLGHKTIEIKVM